MSPRADLFDLQGRVALVTGASSGIGRRLAAALASSGAAVVLLARRRDALETACAEIDAAGGRGAPLVGDLGAGGQIEALAAAAAQPFGPPQILINAAGINPRQGADEVTPEQWQATLQLNLTAPFFLARALVAGMAAAGYGRIINIASLQSRRAFAKGIAYGASKGGVTQLTRAMAEAWSPRGITCNAIAPGFFPTALSAAVFEDDSLRDRMAEQTAIGRNGRLEDLDGLAIFLAAPASGYITGQTIYVDGGFTAK